MNGHNNVVLVDDDLMFNFIHTKIIEKANLGYVVKTFDNATAALADLSGIANTDMTDFSCTIFVDINMPGLDGWGFLDRFSELPASFVNACNVYMLSSSNDISDVNRSHTYGLVKGYISKPLQMQHFMDIATPEFSPVKRPFHR